MAATNKSPRRPSVVPAKPADRAIAYFDPQRAVGRLKIAASWRWPAGLQRCPPRQSQLSSWNPRQRLAHHRRRGDLPTLRDQPRQCATAVGCRRPQWRHHRPGRHRPLCQPRADHEQRHQPGRSQRPGPATPAAALKPGPPASTYDIIPHDFYDHCRALASAWLEGGDSFVLTPRIAHPGRPMRLAAS